MAACTAYRKMSIYKIISREAILPLVKATSEKTVALTLAQTAGSVYGLEASIINKAILNKDADSRQHVSMGVAILHAALEGLKSSHAVFARLETHIDFTSVDDEPVDLVLLIITAQSSNNLHLQTLAEASRLLRSRTLCKKLRGSTTADAMYALLTDSSK